MTAQVISVSRRQERGFSKQQVQEIVLEENSGVAGDFHAGRTIQHVFEKNQNPDQPNLRQVHLQTKEVLDWLKTKGYDIAPGEMGENITTQGIDLMSLPLGTRLHIGEVIIELTGVRTPCRQYNDLDPNLLKVIGNGGNFQTGVMGIVLRSGRIRPGDSIIIDTVSASPLPLPRL